MKYTGTRGAERDVCMRVSITAHCPLACTICKDPCIELQCSHGAWESNRTQCYSTTELVLPWQQPLSPQKRRPHFSFKPAWPEGKSIVSSATRTTEKSYHILSSLLHPCISQPRWKWGHRKYAPSSLPFLTKQKGVSVECVRLFHGLEKAGLCS